MNQVLQEIESRGQGFNGYKFPAQDFASPDFANITYLGLEQTIWVLDKRMCQGIDASGICKWIEMADRLRDFLSWIPCFKDHSHYSPIIFLATWYGVVYIIDFISIAMNMEVEEGWRSISAAYPT